MRGYRLHIEADEAEATAFRTKAEVKKEIRRLAKEYGRTVRELEGMAYVITEVEYQEEQRMKREG